MISIVICSADPKALEKVKSSIAETIGIGHEIIAIDNSERRSGICTIYNEGARLAKFPVLCFMHEDISFETKNWGELVYRHLKDNKIGMIGIAGGDSKSMVPSSWSIPVVSNEINLIQHYKHPGLQPTKQSSTNPATQGMLKRVVALDGVWLCTRKEVFLEFQFDEVNFKGFHGYDIDYSLQVGTKYELFVAFDILIRHFSEGSPDRKWINSAIAVSKKWKNYLPVSVHDLSFERFSFHHWHSLWVFLQHLFRLKYWYPTIIGYYLSYSFTRFFSIRKFLSLGRFVLENICNSFPGKKKRGKERKIEVQSPGAI